MAWGLCDGRVEREEYCFLVLVGLAFGSACAKG